MITADSLLVLTKNCTHLRVLHLNLCHFDDPAAILGIKNVVCVRGSSPRLSHLKWTTPSTQARARMAVANLRHDLRGTGTSGLRAAR